MQGYQRLHAKLQQGLIKNDGTLDPGNETEGSKAPVDHAKKEQMPHEVEPI